MSFINQCRSSRSQIFCKVGVLIDFAKFTGKHLYQSLFFNHLEASRLQIVKKIIKKETSYGLCGVFTNTFYRVHPLVHPLQSTASVSANLYFLLSHISHISHIYIYIKYIYIYISHITYISHIYIYILSLCFITTVNYIAIRLFKRKYMIVEKLQEPMYDVVTSRSEHLLAFGTLHKNMS